MSTTRELTVKEAVLFYVQKHYAYPEETAEHIIKIVEAPLQSELTRLREQVAVMREALETIAFDKVVRTGVTKHMVTEGLIRLYATVALRRAGETEGE